MRALGIFVLVSLLAACGDVEEPFEHHPYASDVVAFSPGEAAGHGENEFPGNVLGVPNGAGVGQGAVEGVLSLGIGGSITLAFDEPIIDGPGADLVVFENAFWVKGDEDQVWAEFGEVAVSSDGESWSTFACEPDHQDPATWSGCAGWNPVLPYDTAMEPVEPEATGGDAFDLAAVGADEVRLIRITDLSRSGTAPSAGFDLDGVAGIYR